MFRKTLFIPVVFMLLLTVWLAWTQFMRPYEFRGAVLQTPKLESGVVLRSAAGPVRLSDYKGKIVLLYFGYTSCPDVCPTSLAKLKMALSKLSPTEAAQVQVIFISVDPARDTPEKLAEYAQVFGSDFIGASGTRSEIDLTVQSFGVYYRINAPDADGNYTVDHSSLIYAIDRNGYLVMVWGHDIQPDEISADLRSLLKHGIPISEQILAGATPTPALCSLTLMPAHVNAGQGLYEKNCSQCHGQNLQGNPAWQTALEDGSHLPPPLNSTGNAWKYSERELTEIIRGGRNLDKPIHMPAFKDELSYWEIHDIIQYVTTSWDVNQKNYQAGFYTLTPSRTWGAVPAATGTPSP